jgi:hypothetical protein
VAAYRTLDSETFLDHLFVHSRWRGRRLGARLLAASLAAYHARVPSSRLLLDVRAGNVLAERWYARLGFAERARSCWWLGPPPASPPSAPGRPAAARRPEADRQHRAWGFSMITLPSSDGRPCIVGRLYRPYYRFSDPDAARDPLVGAALAALDPARRSLLLASAPQPGPGWRRLAVSRRLASPIPSLLDRLRPAPSL